MNKYNTHIFTQLYNTSRGWYTHHHPNPPISPRPSCQLYALMLMYDTRG